MKIIRIWKRNLIKKTKKSKSRKKMKMKVMMRMNKTRKKTIKLKRNQILKLMIKKQLKIKSHNK